MKASEDGFSKSTVISIQATHSHGILNRNSETREEILEVIRTRTSLRLSRRLGKNRARRIEHKQEGL